MPAYNFSPEFANDVEHRRKRSTIRLSDKGAKVGDTVYLYTGQRTKECRLLGTSVLIDLTRFALFENSIFFDARYYSSTPILNLIARSDGFTDFEEMKNWFKAKYKIQSLDKAPFSGYLHVWS